jgi:hypothetical protein
MKSNLQSSRRSFEEDGAFYAGHIKHKDRSGRIVSRRCLCFVLAAGSIVGASVNFSRAEAYHTAQRAAAGTLPVPDLYRDAAVTLAAVLKTRGFPIVDLYDDTLELDDSTAAAIAKEFAT